jgi:tetratricopeptide (TPR) repeat protein
LASTLVASSCQTTQVERGREAEGVTGTFRDEDAYRKQRDRVLLAEAKDAIRNGRTDTARRLLAQHPESQVDPAMHLMLAESFITDGDLPAARDALRTAAALGVEGAGVERLTATVEELSGDWKAAGEAYLAAASKEPRDTDLLVGHARTLLARGDLRGAAAFLERQTALYPDAADLARAAGDAYLALSAYGEAANHLTRASVLEPGDTSAARGLVLAFALGGYHAAALSRAEHLTASDLDATLHLALGRSALVEGRAERAIGHLSAYLDEEGSDSTAWLDLARANYGLGRYDAALASLQRALTYGRPSAPALMLLGHVRLRVGQDDLALGAYRKALELGADPALLDPLVARLEARISAAPEVVTQPPTGG